MGTYGLLDLPIELIELACGYMLNTSTLKNLRLVCGELDAKIVRPFARRRVGELHLSLCRIDLERLVEISFRPRFANEVRRISIWPSYLDPSSSYLGFFSRAKMSRKSPKVLQADISSERNAREKHRTEVTEQMQFIESGRDVELFSKPRTYLPCLTNIDVGCPWTSCQDDRHTPTFNELTGQLHYPLIKVSAQCSGRAQSNIHHAFTVVMMALNSCTANSIELSVGISRSHDSLHSHIPRDAVSLIPTVKPRQYLENLCGLDLMIDLNSLHAPPAWTL